MKKFLLFLLLGFLGIILIPTKANATHLMGSDITYKCLKNSKDSYTIVVTVYRDCNGVQLGSQSINLKACKTSTSLDLSTKFIVGKEITPVCKKTCTRCKKGSPNTYQGNPGCSFAYGIEQFQYEALLNLKGKYKGCCNFTMSWTSCCRNSNITTGPNDAGFWVEGTLNRCLKKCDNSSYFTNPPVAIVCSEQCITMNMAVNDDDIDDDGNADSLVYYLVKPLESATGSVTYSSGFTYLKPISFEENKAKKPPYTWNPPSQCEGFNVDSTTGDITFKAKKAPQISVFSVKVESWGKDASGNKVKKGEIRRDMQLIILKCPKNTNPILSGLNGDAKNNTGTSNTDRVCEGEKKCWTITSYDKDSLDSVTIEYKGNIKNATWEDLDKKPRVQHPRGKFCFEPAKGQAQSNPYQFVLNGKDDACPVNGRTSKAYRIFVDPSPEALVDTNVLRCGEVEFDIKSVNPKAQIASYFLYGEGGLSKSGGAITAAGIKVKHKYLKPGTYKWNLRMRSKFCEKEDSGSITIDPYVGIDIPRDTAFCNGDTVDYTIVSKTTLGKGPFSYKWNDSTVGPTKPNIKLTKDSTWWVRVYDSTDKCENFDTINFRVKYPIKPNLGPDVRYCWKTPFDLGSLFYLSERKLTSMWSRFPSTAILSFDSLFTARTDSGTYIQTIKDSLGCTSSDTIRVDYNPSIDVEKKDVNACKFTPTTIFSGAIDSTTSTYQWFLIAQNGSPVNPMVLRNKGKDYKKYSSGVDETYYIVATQIFGGVSCSDSDTINIFIKPKPRIDITPVPDQCQNNPPFSLRSYSSTPGGVWLMGDTMFKNAIVNDTFYPSRANSTKINKVLYYYNNPAVGCDTTAILNVQVSPIPKIFAGKDTFVCQGDNSIFKLPTVLKTSPTGGFWRGPGVSGDTFYYNSTSAGGAGRKQIIYTYVDPSSGAGCSNEDTVYIRVLKNINPKTGSYGPYCATESKVALDGLPREDGDIVQNWIALDKSTGNQINGAIQRDVTTGLIYFYPTVVGSVITGNSMDVQLIMEITQQKGKCPKYDTADLTVYAKPNPSFNMPITEFCINDGPIPLVVTETGGRRFFKADNNKGYVKGNYFDPLAAGPGVHKVTYSYTDLSNGVACPNDTYIYLTVYPRPIVTAKVQVACEGEAFTLTADTTSSGSLEWFARDNTATIVDKNSLTTKFFPGASDRLSGKFLVWVKAQARPGATCKEDSFGLTVIIPSKPQIQFEADPLRGCEPLKVQFTDLSDFGNSVGGTYTWDFGDGNTSTDRNPEHTFLYDQNISSYTVTLRATAKNGCIDTMVKSNYITVRPVPTADFIATPRLTTISLPIVEFEDKTDYKAPGLQAKANLIWDFGDGTKKGGSGADNFKVTKEYQDTGKYTIRLDVRNEFGCADEEIKEAFVDIRPEIIVFIPNVFTPNNLFNEKTKANEVFLPIVSNHGSYNLQVFNRWGELMFETTDHTKGWDGKFKGKDCQEGVFVYVLRATSLLGKKYKYSGSMTLLR